MRSNILKFSLLTLILLPLGILADYSDYSYKYYFVNGMFTSKTKAIRNKDELKAILMDYKKNNPDEEVLKYTTKKDIKYSYNQDEFFVIQGLEVYKQKLVDNGTSPSYNDFLTFLKGIHFPTNLDDFKDAMKARVSSVLYNDEDLNTFIDDYARDISSGSKVILIAHSQGNFYANFSYDRLFKLDKKFKVNSLGIVSVATPASRVKDDRDWKTAPYITFTSDKIMNGVRKAFPSTLPATEISKDCGEDSDCHGFLEAYMNTLNDSRKKIINGIIMIAQGLDKSQWKKNGELEKIESCNDRLSMSNENTGVTLDMFPFNDNGYVYDLGGKWVMAEDGGKILLYGWPDQKKYRECFKLDGTGEIMKIDEIYPCDSTKPSPWIITKKYSEGTCDYRVDVENTQTGKTESNVFPFNENGYVYSANNDWVMASCGGTHVYQTIPMPKDECHILGGTGEKIKIDNECDDTKPSIWTVHKEYDKGTCDYRVDVENTQTGKITPDVYPFNTETGRLYYTKGGWVMASCGGASIIQYIPRPEGECYTLKETGEIIYGEEVPKFNCNGTKLKEGEFKIKSTVCSQWSYPNNENYADFYFWLDGIGTQEIYESEGKKDINGIWDFNRLEQVDFANLEVEVKTNNIYCGYVKTNIIEKWGGKTYQPNCSYEAEVFVELTKSKKRSLIGDNKDLCKEGNWEILHQGDKSSCETNRVVVRNKDTGVTLYGVYPFNENGAVYDLDEEFVLGSCGGLKILKDWDGKTEGECYKLDGVSDSIKTEPKFECIGDGRDYGLEVMGSYCSYSGSDSGHFWLKNDGFIDISSSEKGAFASELESKYQHCGVLSKSQIQSYGGDAYCYEAHVYWGEPTLQSRSLRKVQEQKIIPLNPNILDTMSDFNQTEYSKKLNKQK